MRFYIIFLVIILLSACRHDAALVEAERAHLQYRLIDTGDFLLTTYSRISDPQQNINVYIEGDGYAWRSRYEPSSNPTPKYALALQLASLDTSPNVIYVARPCQFTDPSLKACDVAYWTSKRFAPEVVKAINQTIDKLLPPKIELKLHLIGYSGGGAIAVLIASKRGDIASIRTVAGNLDTEALNQYHHVQPMPLSLNPANAAKKIHDIPQIHYVGAQDKLVPQAIANHFVLAQEGHCATVVTLENVTHEDGWQQVWQTLIAKMPQCAE